ncbi:Hypothetical protein SRAE_1000163000 [Strongyloides ratti]|uniref:Uncharacterized protein n=1 Tax=Strongyloides ratti TaxID=34506 RepID=A0A090MW33_STRRB|nr:Hypothetical protein SRAE_1000163000 [Strongyloides ratti]CEF63368.1 Hypothetical protein SRAE_1000163000 [Strongyloides ratti]
MPPRTIRYRPKSQPPLHYFNEIPNVYGQNNINRPQSTNLNQKNLRSPPNLYDIDNSNIHFLTHNQTSNYTNTSTNSTLSLSPSDRSFSESQNIMEKNYYQENCEKNLPNLSQIRINNNYSPELISFVDKHQTFLEEEGEILNQGLENTRALLEWYQNRWNALKKRKNMLDRGLVALDTAVHEQKLNFLRAQITILNNRIKDLLLSTEFGMPDNAVIGSGNVKIGFDKDSIPLIKMPKREVKLCDFKKDKFQNCTQNGSNEHLKIRHRVPINDYHTNTSGSSTPSSFITRYTNKIPDTLC